MKKKMFYLGKEPITGRDVGIEGSRHLLCGAQNEAGKGSGIIVPNLLGYPGSILCTDPNLENANITAGPCSDNGFESFVLDPYNNAKGRAAELRCKFNILDEVDIKSPTIKEDLWKIAEGCIAAPRNKSDNSEFFVNAARELWCSAIAHVLSTEMDPAKRNLPWIRTRIEFQGSDFFKEMEDNFEVDGLPAAGARRLRDAGNNEAGGYMTTLRDQTRWISSIVMQAHLAPTGNDRIFRTDWLHSKKVRLYLGLPGGRTSYQANWIGMIVNWTLLRLSENKDKRPATGYPVTLLLDEFGNISNLEYIDRHLGELRHYCRLAIFVQGLNQIKKDYPLSYDGFLQNCVKLFFGIEDLETAKYLSEACGDRIWHENQSNGGFSMRRDDPSASFNVGDHRYRERFMSPEQLMRLLAPETRRMLLLTRPYPAIIERVPYWERFRKHEYDPNPKYDAQHVVADASSFEKILEGIRRWL